LRKEQYIMQNATNIRGVIAVRAETDPAQLLMGQIKAGFEAFKADHKSQFAAMSDRLQELEQKSVGEAVRVAGLRRLPRPPDQDRWFPYRLKRLAGRVCEHHHAIGP